MMLKIAIVGLPNVGKSTLFNALTDGEALAANYPFATIEPNTGIVPVPDERLNVLAKMYKTDKIVPATVEFVDVAGLVAGASKGEGLGNKFLANIRETDAICHVVRAFSSGHIQRADGATTIDPKGDIEVINTELALADVTTIENHLPKLQKEAKANPKLKSKVDFLASIQSQLLTGKRPTEFNKYSKAELADQLNGLSLLTAKPVIYLFNVEETDLTNHERQTELRQLAAAATGDNIDNINAIFVCAELESEIRSLSIEEASELMADYGVAESGLNKLIKAAYHILGLQSYLTAGVKEVRAWTIHQGWTAPQAAGVIHTDFERGFIAAQVVNYNDLIEYGSETAARAAGKLRTEGKAYIMQPDDVVEFRFNV
ncbi:MAG: redox-regulated ATPase YchF [Candidatus Saccharibacteria bacterium]|nr:redox-regulated ATPase YchF [Candidatus Saccharibacteria bacterium]